MIPQADLARSTAAARVGRLAGDSDLVLAHFEYRVALPEPQAWDPERPDLGPPPWDRTWVAGSLPETKFRDFRLEGMVGSFHPGHRGKWTAHELCHRLVGFAWHPGASPWFTALAARLSELLPVVLYYFADEADLRRCPRHAGGGPLFQGFCVACEKAAQEGALDEPDDRWCREAHAFIDRELAATARSRRLGRPISNRFGTLDLCEDGLAYAAAHEGRLGSEAFALWMERFGEAGWHRDLDALEARVLAVWRAISEEAPLPSWTGDRWRWIAQELGWRLTLVGLQLDGERQQAVDGIVAALADAQDRPGVEAACSAYTELAVHDAVPPPDEALALGLDLPGGHGRSHTQILAGLDSVSPDSLAEVIPGTVEGFVAWDAAPRREGLGLRWARFLKAEEDEPAASMARLDAAVHHAPPALQPMPLSPAERWFLAPHAQLFRTAWDPDGPRPQPVWWLVARSVSGERLALRVEAHVAELLQQRPLGELPEELASDLLAEGLLEAEGIIDQADAG